jgi:hypothetical protein
MKDALSFIFPPSVSHTPSLTVGLLLSLPRRFCYIPAAESLSVFPTEKESLR